MLDTNVDCRYGNINIRFVIIVKQNKIDSLKSSNVAHKIICYNFFLPTFQAINLSLHFQMQIKYVLLKYFKMNLRL